MKAIKNGWLLGFLFFLLTSALTALFAFIGLLFKLPVKSAGFLMGVLGVIGIYLSIVIFAFLYTRNFGEFTKKQRTSISLTYFVLNSFIGLIVGIVFKPYPYAFILTIAVVALIFAAIIYWLLAVEARRYILTIKGMRSELKTKTKKKIKKKIK
ncbi:hypothetical protein DRJ17_02790 [Candidatus Woesearchaeota archaeon]|nr:MAG: hypothetical protein DRJ17_02790 [Candidatus Woesearchaeota archaeon]